MNKIILIAICLVASFNPLWAQDNYVNSYNWEENPTAAFKASEHQDKDLVALKESRISEFVFLENAGLVENLLIHNIFWLNSNDIIEGYNKVYLPAIPGSRILKNKARVISKDGKITELDDSKILESRDNERQTVSKYYAMEGIEKGSFIEYFFVIQKYPNYTGKRVLLQNDYFKKEVDFEVFSPSNLKFAFKTYNETKEVVKDTLVKDRNHWVLNLKNVPALESEESSAYLTSLKQVNFKLDRNYATPNKEIVSFGNISQTLYSRYYTEIDKKTKSKVQKLLKKLQASNASENSIRLVENYIKSTIYLNKSSSDPSLSAISNIIETNTANDFGVMSLFISIFNQLEIAHELVLTSNRNELLFDETFETYNILAEYLFYFPEYDTYLQPLNYGSRYGFPEGMLMDNKGLFVKRVKIGDFESAVGEVKYINAVNYDKSAYNLKMQVAFDSENINKTNISLDRIMTGYYALGLQPYMSVMKEENKKKSLEGVVKSIKDDLKILDIKATNTAATDFGTAPFIVNANVETETFVDNAGKKYLFKIGELIGPQLEMYQESERKLVGQNDFERTYKSDINVKIPQGYTFKNLDDLIIDESYEEDGRVFFSFKSNYSIENGLLKVTINEFYNQNIIQVPIYEDYRKVINSAANFNKVILVMIEE